MTETELKGRIGELELLCRDVLTVGVELGLPQALLQRLWQVHNRDSRRASLNLDLGNPPRATAPAQPQDEVSGGSPLAPVSQRRTVLVADDDPLMIELLTKILQRENYELITARDGGEALALAEQRDVKVDLLVADCEMPVMKGPELAQRLRKSHPGIKILYQTGFAEMLFDDKSFLGEGTTLLEKPFTARGLQEAVRLALFGTVNPG